MDHPLRGNAAVAAGDEPSTLSAAAAIGIDLSGHRSRCVDGRILATDGNDLVLVMTRAHLRAGIGMERRAWSRTFTLKEFARRAADVTPATPDEGFAGWRRRLADGRRAADMMTADPRDDLADPYGLALRRHVEMLSEVERLVDQVVRVGPWQADDVHPRERLANDRW